MPNLKLLLALATTATILALSATPALAEFEATAGNGTSTGPVELESGSTATFRQPGLPVVCSSLTNGAWHIEVSKEIVKPQEPASRGPHLGISGQFSACVVLSGGLKLAVKINPSCELQLRVNGSSTSATGRVVKDCILNIPSIGCEIKIPAASNEGGLSKINVASKTGAVEVNAEVLTGVTFLQTGCPFGNGTNGGIQAKVFANGLKLV